MKYKSYNNRNNWLWITLLLVFFFFGFRVFFVILGLVFVFFPLLFFVILSLIIFNSINKNNQIYSYTNTQSKEHNEFVELLTRVSAHLINADGKIEQVEIQTFKNFFITKLGFNNEAVLWVEDLLHSELKKQHDLQELAGEINKDISNELKLVLLDLLYQIAYSDFDFHNTEQELLVQIAKLINISEYDLKLISGRYERGSTATSTKAEYRYYKTLGLQEGATQEEIKKVYRELVKKFHPDVVNNLGEDFRLLAEKKMKEITEAYEQVMSRARKE